MNTPKAPQVDDLMFLATGLKKVSDSWRWQGMTAASARTKLEKLVVTRGKIAHRVADENPVYRHECQSYLTHVENLVWYTRDAVVKHLKSM